jgi:glycosyltransferase involved in cell wall biosynthesis
MSLHQGGIGGSETALVQVATRLAQDGYEVKVYAQAEAGLYAGALWRPHSAWDPSEDADLLVVSRIPQVFDNPIAAARTALWCHDHSYASQITEARADRITDVVVLSDWQRDRFAELYPFLDGKLRLIRNGITYTDPQTGETRFPDGGRSFEERKPWCVYSSSADRGLDVLVRLWPRIRNRVKDAELHVFYGWETFDRFAVSNPQLLDFKARVLGAIGEAGGERAGIFMHGRVGQSGMYEAMQQARVWSYPTYFQETSCIGAMEARASGLAVVTSRLAALEETVGEHGVLLDPRKADGPDMWEITARYGDLFVDEVSRLLSDPGYWQQWHEKARDGVEELDWAEQLPGWEELVPMLARAAA